jgi:hypothetical protein
LDEDGLHPGGLRHVLLLEVRVQNGHLFCPEDLFLRGGSLGRTVFWKSRREGRVGIVRVG